MTAEELGSRAIAHILTTYPALTPDEALAFIHICADDGLSLKSLSKRMEEGQSTVSRYVAALEQVGVQGDRLVVLSDTQEGDLRRTVSLSKKGRALRDKLK